MMVALLQRIQNETRITDPFGFVAGWCSWSIWVIRSSNRNLKQMSLWMFARLNQIANKRSRPELWVQSLCERHLRWMKLQNVVWSKLWWTSLLWPPQFSWKTSSQELGKCFTDPPCFCFVRDMPTPVACSMSSITQNPATRTFIVSASCARAMECNNRHSW